LNTSSIHSALQRHTTASRPTTHTRYSKYSKVTTAYQFAELPYAETGTYLPYEIVQCYLPPGRGVIPANAHSAKLVLNLATLGGCRAELT